MAEDRFEEILGAISDGAPVDWARLGAVSTTPEEKRWLRNLRVVADVGRLAREGTADAPSPSGSGDALPFETWGHLKLLERIGGGAFGDVYRAWDETLHRQVALKLLKRTLQGDDRWEARFLAEGRLMARVEHPHVVRIHGAETHEGRPGYWMELVDGVSLERRLIEDGPPEPGRVAALGADLAEALAAVHDAGVVHQDVKPANVLVDPAGRARLMDFGAGGPRSGGAGAAAGTPHYMAPEVAAGGPPTPRSDVYGLGVLLRALLASGAGPDRLPGLREAIDRAADPDPARRFPTAAAFGAALRDVAAREETARPRAARRRSRLRIGAGLAAVAGLALVLFWMFGPHGRNVTALSGSARFVGVSGESSRDLAGGDAVSARDRIEIVLTLSRDAYVYILNADQAGRTVVMFPMAGARDRNPLAGGATHRLPGRIGGRMSGWTLSADPGDENFLIVASATRLAEFEAALDGVPAVDLAGGLSVQPIPADVVAVLTRSVTGHEPLAGAAGAAPDLFELARDRAREPDDRGSVWLHEVRLVNRGG